MATTKSAAKAPATKKPAAKAPAAEKSTSSISKEKAKAGQLVAYDVKTKTKQVPMHIVTIEKTERGVFMARGTSSEGNSLTTMVSEAKAKEAIKAGMAKKNW